MSHKNELRNEIDVGYTQVPNEVLWSSELTPKAKALYAYLASKPPGWTFYQSAVIDEQGVGRAAVANGLQELEDAGLLTRERVRDGGGQFDGSRWTLHAPDTAESDKPDCGSTGFGSTGCGKPASGDRDAREDCSNTDDSKNDRTNTESSAPAPGRATPDTYDHIFEVDDHGKFVEQLFAFIDRSIGNPQALWAKVARNAPDAATIDRREYIAEKATELAHDPKDYSTRQIARYVTEDASEWREYVDADDELDSIRSQYGLDEGAA